jgi:hypothetical protein
MKNIHNWFEGNENEQNNSLQKKEKKVRSKV